MSKDDKLKIIEIEEKENKKLLDKLIDNNDNLIKNQKKNITIIKII